MDLLIQKHLRGFGHEPELPAPWLDPSCNRQPNSQQQRHGHHASSLEEFALRIATKENQNTNHFLRTDFELGVQTIPIVQAVQGVSNERNFLTRRCNMAAVFRTMS